MNFMNTNICSDTDIYMFTICQGNAMRQAPHTSPQRNPLLSSTVYKPNQGFGIATIQEQGLEIYPNPISDKLILNSTSTSYSLKITDALGRLVYSEKNLSGKKEINTINWEQGLYILYLCTDTKIISGKVVKQ